MKGRKFDAQTIATAINPICRTEKPNRMRQIKASRHDNKMNMSDYFRSSANKLTEKSKLSINKQNS